MRQHQLGESGPDFDAALAELFADGAVEHPGEDVLQRWLDEDQADFDRAVLISQLVSQSEPRVVIPPVAAPAAVAERVRQPARAEPSPAPSRPARGSGSPSVTDLLDGMFAQQGGR